MIRECVPGSQRALKTALLIAMVLAATASSLGQETIPATCGTGPRPVVELLPVSFDGEAPDALRHHQLRFTEDFWRSWAWFELRPKYPCTAFQLIERDVDSGEPRRLGAQGDAPYEIRGMVRLSLEPRVVPVLRLSSWNGVRRTEESLELVTALGRVQVDFELVSKASGAVYDTGRYLIDWVPLPPGEDIYEAAPDRISIIEGAAYQAADAVFFGEGTPEPSRSHVPSLKGGDPGLTIRMRETPHFLRAAAGAGTGPEGRKGADLFVFDERGELLPDGVSLAVSWGEGTEQIAITREGKLVLSGLEDSPEPCAEDGASRIVVGRALEGAAPPLAITLANPGCLQAWVSVSVRSHRSRHSKEPSLVDACTAISSIDFEETREAAFLFEIESVPQVETLDTGHELHRYELLDTQLVDAFFLLTAREGDERICAFPERLNSCSRRLGGRPGPLQPSPDGSGKHLVLTVDPKTGEVLDARIPRIVFPLAWSGRSLCRVREYLPVEGTSSQWQHDEFTGAAEANEIFSSHPDPSVIREIGDDSSCFTPSPPAAAPALFGGCKAQKTEDGWRLETSYEWVISLH